MPQPLFAEAAAEDFRRHLEKYDWSDQSPSRRQILQAFLRLATTNGFQSVSMRMIAKVVNIKAPSIYAHFPDGRDEIVAESLRWHFHQFGTAVLDETDMCTSPADFWSAMVRVHLTRQLELPESNLWDLLVATDKMVHVLPAEVRDEAAEWVGLYEGMYNAVAQDLGIEEPYEGVRIVMTLLEGATRWCDWDGSEGQLAALADRAVQLTRSVLSLGR
ncbi:TetR/AcrR family transcriptional regulator [Rhodococcus sp. IEGM 1307]|uniref:TetR/AcrR family transcriptional regulator n=1 Tax=Rhodococcus sp. IEGM 1307 TaxID=3047091 RepID=UPI0024B67AF5|nr:TetR/AcrR family transcriptional regulator [Rhodococcus sp. IEGM 1307]MDI9978694.1 TetR/AcrR family transcriptional regulator [Rhodococcus sp. IEGM 1307]